MCHYLFSLITFPVALPAPPSLITSLVWSMLNMAELGKALPPRLSAGIHYSPRSSHPAPLPAAAPPSPPAAAGQRPRAAHAALWQPAPRRAETGRGRALPRGPVAAERRRLRLGRPGDWRPAEGEAEEARPLHPRPWQVRRQMRAPRSGSALEGATCPAVRALQWHPLCGERSPPRPSTCPRLSTEWEVG